MAEPQPPMAADNNRNEPSIVVIDICKSCESMSIYIYIDLEYIYIYIDVYCMYRGHTHTHTCVQ